MRFELPELPEHGGANDPKILDFSANLNPLGMPENVRAELIRSLQKMGGWERYPDPDCAELIKLLSERLGVLSESIICGNGAADLIYRIIAAVSPKNALIAAPCFSEYAKALRESDCEITEHFLSEERGFRLDESIFESISRLGESDMLILASPNNPTGQVIPSTLLRAICAECERRKIIFLCDESFLDFTRLSEFAESVREFINPYVISLCAFTKTYALAGLRLGYAVFGDEDLARTVKKRGQYWSVSAPAQIAGIAALNSGDYLERSRRMIFTEREILKKSLSGLGLKVFDSNANFLLIKSAKPLYKPLLERRIMLRQAANFAGLSDEFYRIAVRTPGENATLITAIRDIIYGE